MAVLRQRVSVRKGKGMENGFCCFVGRRLRKDLRQGLDVLAPKMPSMKVSIKTNAVMFCHRLGVNYEKYLSE